ncbi:MAG: hypothetical protein U0796_03980 [Gemmatales bacterium]
MAELIEVVLGLLAKIAPSDKDKDVGWRWIWFVVILLLAVFGLAFGWLLWRQ